jgi:uncharacterized damage-inducible protein DinB
MVNQVGRRSERRAVPAFYGRLFGYDEWANRATLVSLRAGPASERARKLMAHVAATESLWYDRLVRRPQRHPVWPDFTLDQSEALANDMAAAWREYLAAMTPAALGEETPYSNTKGERWVNSVADVLTHVIMHSAYHRGQIAAEVRAQGGEPAYTDFIEAVRRGYVGEK